MPFLTNHLRTVNESYFQHCKHALRFAFTLLLAGIVCLVHALLPFLFEKTGSTIIKGLYRDMVDNRHNLTPSRAYKMPSGVEGRQSTAG